MADVFINTNNGVSEVIINGRRMTVNSDSVTVTRGIMGFLVNGVKFTPDDETKTKDSNESSSDKKYKIMSGRVVALVDIPSKGVSKFDVGGKVDNEGNLSQHGDCWLDYESEVTDGSSLSGDAYLSSSKLTERTKVSGRAYISNSFVKRSNISGNSSVNKSTIIDSSLSGNSRISNSQVESSLTSGNTSVTNSYIFNEQLSGNSRVQNQGTPPRDSHPKKKDSRQWRDPDVPSSKENLSSAEDNNENTKVDKLLTKLLNEVGLSNNWED